MNDKIEKLALEVFSFKYKTSPNELNPGHHMDHIYKFAELIVRECNQAVLEVPCYYKDYRSQIEEAVINDCARAVLEHFGVE